MQVSIRVEEGQGATALNRFAAHARHVAQRAEGQFMNAHENVIVWVNVPSLKQTFAKHLKDASSAIFDAPIMLRREFKHMPQETFSLDLTNPEGVTSLRISAEQYDISFEENIAVLTILDKGFVAEAPKFFDAMMPENVRNSPYWDTYQNMTADL